MKKDSIKLLILWCLAALFVFALSPVAGAEDIYSSVIRIHVLANSDSEADQEIKMSVRDEILAYSKENFAGFSSVSEAKKAVEQQLFQIEAAAKEVLAENGCEDAVSALLSEEYYPTKTYEGFSLPGGKYLSLQIRIGKAEGNNWWCVLFPPICLNSAVAPEDALLSAGMSDENVKTVTLDNTEYAVRFRALEFYHAVKEKISSLF